MTNFFDEDEISDLGISADIVNLQKANNGFSDQYNQRVKEKSTTSAELTKQLRLATEVGQTCAASLDIVNQLIKDARPRLNARLGKSQDPEVLENTENQETPEESAE